MCFVLTGRFIEGLTLDQVGAQMGLTKERVRQLESKALGKLRVAAGAPKAASPRRR